MVRKNPDFHFQIIMLLFVLAVLPMIFFGSQIRLSLAPSAAEPFPVWQQVKLPTSSPTPWPTQIPLSFAQPKDITSVNDLKTLVYVSPTPTPTPSLTEILSTPNTIIVNLFSLLVRFVGNVASFIVFTISQFGH